MDDDDDDVDPTAPSDEELDAAIELLAGNVLAWLRCRCDMHLWYVGLASDQGCGFAPRLMLEMAGQQVTDWLDDDPDEEAPDLTPLIQLLGAVADNIRDSTDDG